MLIKNDSALSTDANVSGFGDQTLKVLLVKCKYSKNDLLPDDSQLSGATIVENKFLHDTTFRVLSESSYREIVFLEQNGTFFLPERVPERELERICNHRLISTAIPTDEPEKPVTYERARYYVFEDAGYEKTSGDKFKLSFLNNLIY